MVKDKPDLCRSVVEDSTRRKYANYHSLRTEHTPQPLYDTIVGIQSITVLVIQPGYIQTKSIDYIEK